MRYVVLTKQFSFQFHFYGNCWLTHPRTYADFAFIPWDNAISWIFGEDAAKIVPEDKYPNFFAWHKRLLARPAVQAALVEQGKARAQAHKK